jgi:hypothetical protein
MQQSNQELQNTRQELSKWKAYAIELNEVKSILENNQNITSLADAAKAFLSTKQQEIDRKATEKFDELKKKWETLISHWSFSHTMMKRLNRR